jgi:SnoaL-like protein
MITIEKILDGYTATWTENDPGRRRELIAELYAPDAVYANQGNEYHGIAGVEVAVVRNWDKFISDGYAFEVAGGAAAHHGSARVPWRMLAPGGATVAAAGMQFLLLDDTGRVRGDYQFITQAPPA